MTIRITGRSSSHFTRTARIFAHELGVAYEFSPVLDLMSSDARDYAGNPALKLPVLSTGDDEALYGTLNICRELARRAPAPRTLVWPEQLTAALAANAQELTLHSMASEVGLIMGSIGASAQPAPYAAKSLAGLHGSLSWLEQHCARVLEALPEERDLSYLEVTLFCLVTHLSFRRVLDVTPYASLVRFAAGFGERKSALATPYRYDA